ncbi:DMT family transporter [Palleronia caenipelagi]|uniref:DMT family transporter n=1 Tax=Palleronia caenipelagi TaxID=2489174 RepID=A0A547QAR5_9RHOB|nr:DMT family transporter [Palleronia caenipelagi]TRD23450.1 DMT family transporter [Palleronia caenipelagi]
MRLSLTTALVMIAFAANSLLNRAAVEGGHAAPLDFALVRLISGAVVLGVLVGLSGGGLVRAFDWRNVAALSLYMLGFSLAYVSLPAGAGALILFAAVQVTMFSGGVLVAEEIPMRRWVGVLAALSGLIWMLWPGEAALSPRHGILMAIAGIGWGIYSLRGRGTSAPMRMTATSFIGAVPVVGLVWLVWPGGGMDAVGWWLAILCGAVTSGLGYALWYQVLPRLGASRAALAQLTVPVIAVGAGVVLLGEALSLRLILSCAVVIGGVALGLSRPRL